VTGKEPFTRQRTRPRTSLPTQNQRTVCEVDTSAKAQRLQPKIQFMKTKIDHGKSVPNTQQKSTKTRRHTQRSKLTPDSVRPACHIGHMTGFNRKIKKKDSHYYNHRRRNCRLNVVKDKKPSSSDGKPYNKKSGSESDTRRPRRNFSSLKKRAQPKAKFSLPKAALQGK